MENSKQCAWCGKPVAGLEAAGDVPVCDVCWEHHAAPRRALYLARKAARQIKRQRQPAKRFKRTGR